MAHDDTSLRALRDFFAAVDAQGLRAAYVSLPKGQTDQQADGQAKGTATADVPDAEAATWLQVEYAFNRLFVGPDAVVAPPVASVWLEAEPRVMGDVTLEVRGLYHALGVNVPDEGTAPDDHLAYELDALLALRWLRRQEDSASLRAAHHWLVCEHMASWIPCFTAAVTADENVPSPISHVLNRLEQALLEERLQLRAERPTANEDGGAHA